jgi:uncharacterized alpha/beta hydrolase family protein
MKKVLGFCIFALTVQFTGSANAADTDVNQLNQRVDQKVAQIEETGFLPTSTEIEVIAGDIVSEEVTSGEITVDQAVEKYQLTPTLERYIKIKKVQEDIADANKSAGGGREPPK